MRSPRGAPGGGRAAEDRPRAGRWERPDRGPEAGHGRDGDTAGRGGGDGQRRGGPDRAGRAGGECWSGRDRGNRRRRGGERTCRPQCSRAGAPVMATAGRASTRAAAVAGGTAATGTMPGRTAATVAWGTAATGAVAGGTAAAVAWGTAATGAVAGGTAAAVAWGTAATGAAAVAVDAEMAEGVSATGAAAVGDRPSMGERVGVSERVSPQHLVAMAGRHARAHEPAAHEREQRKAIDSPASLDDPRSRLGTPQKGLRCTSSRARCRDPS